MMKRLLYVISILGFVFLMQNCKPKEEEADPSTGIVLTVKAKNTLNESENVADADVYLFDSFTAYDAFKQSLGTLTNYVQKGVTDSEGKYTFCDLEADSVLYYFYAQSGSLNNDGSEYEMGGTLYENAAHYVTLNLTGFITKKVHFYSKDPLVTGNNIKIYLSENGTINSTSLYTLFKVGDAAVSNPDQGNYIYAPANGSYTYYIKNENGCVWTEVITVNNTSEFNKELSSCGTEFKFYSSDLSGGSINVFLNNETTPIGTITASGLANAKTATRPSGTYTYRAEHSNGTCTWIETTDGSAPVNLSGCN